MNIFCKETQEHLQSIQSQVEAGVLPKVSVHTSSISMFVLDVTGSSSRTNQVQKESYVQQQDGGGEG